MTPWSLRTRCKCYFQHFIKVHFSIIHTAPELLLHSDLEKWLRATGTWLKSQLQNPRKGIRLLWLSEREKRTSCPAPFKNSWFPITSEALSCWYTGAEMWQVNPAAEKQALLCALPFKLFVYRVAVRSQSSTITGRIKSWRTLEEVVFYQSKLFSNVS